MFNIKEETLYGIHVYSISTNKQIFKFMIFQLSESSFVIRPLEELVRLPDDEKTFVPSFKYNAPYGQLETGRDIINKDIDNSLYYDGLLKYILDHSVIFGKEFIEFLDDSFRLLCDNSDREYIIYYMHPDGLLLKIYSIVGRAFATCLSIDPVLG